MTTPGDIEIRGVTKRFGAVTVLEDVSLTIRENEFMVFLGPSGCGKSTLLRMIAGLEGVDAGTISIGGERIDTLPPGRRGIAMVFQSYALYPHMTVSENMAFGLRNVGAARDVIAARIADAARILEIGHLLDRKPGELSGGQRQRVAIGRAIVKEPKAFLFDEPLSNLDAALRSRTRVELAQLRHRVRSTMVLVTHDQVEAMTLADRIVVMNNRCIEQIGTPMEIYSRPATRFVATFVGSPTMTFLAATAEPDPNGFLRASVAGGQVIQTQVPTTGFLERDCSLGIRAEAVRIVPPAPDGLEGQVDVLERLGDRTLVYVKLPSGETVAAEDAGNSRLTIGEAVGLRIDGARAHLFDAAGKGWHAEDAGHG